MRRPAAPPRSNAAPAVAEPVAPYTVRKYAAVAGQSLLVCFDAAGEPFFEARVPAAVCSTDLIERIRAWCRENDPWRLQIVP